MVSQSSASASTTFLGGVARSHSSFSCTGDKDRHGVLGSDVDDLRLLARVALGAGGQLEETSSVGGWCLGDLLLGRAVSLRYGVARDAPDDVLRTVTVWGGHSPITSRVSSSWLLVVLDAEVEDTDAAAVLAERRAGDGRLLAGLEREREEDLLLLGAAPDAC